MIKPGSGTQEKTPAPGKSVLLLNQLLRTMLGIISAHNSAPGVSREIAKQICLAVRGDWALVCGWDVQTNTLSVRGEYRESKSKKTAILQSGIESPLGPALERILGNRKPVQLPSTSPAAKELSSLISLPKDGAALLLIPVRYLTEPAGLVVVISSTKDRKFSEAERIVSQIFANHAAVILENIQLRGNAQRSAMEIEGLRKDALTDVLTGLPNRRSFDLRLQEEERRATRYKRIFSLVMIDLDNFKRINDLHGHRAGDVALQDIARCLRSKVRDTDFLARFGGDEFVLVLPETSGADARKVCEKLQSGLAECAIVWGREEDAVSFSYGIAEYPQDAQAAPLLVGAADKAMYGEKGKSEAPGLGV